MSDRITGTVKFFNGEKGFGFITPENGQKDVFVHHTAIQAEGYRNLNEGDRVEFSIEPSNKGPRAAEVIKL
ncbi:MAG TPA: cold-shock protein [Ardenticatenaceae bacterium]|jgi:CspA family cold shock protein